jgi:hypothetical protein
MACPQSKGDLLLRRNGFLFVLQRNNHRRFLAYAQLDLLGTLVPSGHDDLLDLALPDPRRLVAHLIAPNVPIR